MKTYLLVGSQRICKILVLCVIILSLLFYICIPGLAAGAPVEQLPILTYVLAETEYSIQATENDLIGTYTYSPERCGNVYLISLPYGSTFLRIQGTNESAYTNYTPFGTASASLDPEASNYIGNLFLEDSGFISSSVTPYYRAFYNKCELTEAIPSENVKGFAVLCGYAGTAENENLDNIYDAYIIQISTVDGGPVPAVTYGDLTGDKEITTDDAAMLYGALRGAVTLTEEQTAAADVNHDGEITADDAGMVYGYLRGQIISFESVGN